MMDDVKERDSLVGLAHEIWAMSQTSPGASVSEAVDTIVQALRDLSSRALFSPIPDRQALVTWALAQAKEHVSDGMEATAERFLLVAKAMSSPPPRLWIAAAAINAGGLIASMPRPARHGDVLRSLHEMLEGRQVAPGVQGFIANDGRFLDRVTAAMVAFEAGQLSELKGELFSEDLW